MPDTPLPEPLTAEPVAVLNWVRVNDKFPPLRHLVLVELVNTRHVGLLPVIDAGSIDKYGWWSFQSYDYRQGWKCRRWCEFPAPEDLPEWK